MLGSSAAPSSTPAGDHSRGLGRVSQFLGKLQLRKRVAGGIRQLAEQTAQSISKYAVPSQQTVHEPVCMHQSLFVHMGCFTQPAVHSPVCMHCAHHIHTCCLSLRLTQLMATCGCSPHGAAYRLQGRPLCECKAAAHTCSVVPTLLYMLVALLTLL